MLQNLLHRKGSIYTNEDEQASTKASPVPSNESAVVVGGKKTLFLCI